MTPSTNGRKVVRLTLRGTLDVPLPPDTDLSDEEEWATLVDQAIADLTADDLAGAVEIEGTEVGELDATGNFQLTPQ